MIWKSFHHPDISLPVIRRRMCDELIIILQGTADMVRTWGKSDLYGYCYPDDRSYRQSLKRMEAKGLLATSPQDGSLPNIRLTEKAVKLTPPYLAPETYWNRSWPGHWYILMFDVPEKNRSYRDNLRAFLKKNLFGCLQKSVWITPHDFRPEYDDLNRAACVDSVAYLFEAKTVLGYGNDTVAREAWNFNKLTRIQEQYIQYTSNHIDLLNSRMPTEYELIQLLRIDHNAYSQAMILDPLLPEQLLPQDYAGKNAFLMHRKLTKNIFSRLK